MQQLLRAYADILLRRRGPDILPDSGFLLQLAFIAYCAINLLALLVEGSLRTQFANASFAVLFDAVLLCLWFGVLLGAAGYPGRLRQVLCAALGCGALIGLYMLPVIAVMKLLPRIQSVAVLAYFVLLFWYAMALGHIVARAMEIHPLAGLGFGVFYIIASFLIVGTLFPLGS